MRTRAAGESSLLLLDAIEVLSAAGIDYAVIGAMAVAVHGVVRASVDADAVLSIRARDAQELRDAFAGAGFIAELRKGDFEDPIAAVLEIKDAFDNRVDLVVGLKGMDPAMFSRTIEVPFAGEVLKVVGREDLIAMKLFAGGPKDLLDVEHVAEAAIDALDVVLLRRLVQLYGSDALANFKALFPSAT